MRKVLPVMALAVAIGSADAQTVSIESKRLADALTSTTWPSMEASMSMAVAGGKARLQATGASERAAEVFVDELQRSFTKENIARFLAASLSESFSEAELKELAAFLLSPLGQRYLQMSNDATRSTRLVLPMYKEACDAASRRLSPSELSSICK